MVSTGLLKIDLTAIVANWVFISKYIKQFKVSVECGAVVKANAYGLGVTPVAKALQLAGCRQFFVATLDEGVVLRKVIGKGSSVVVFGGLAHGLCDEWYSHRLTPVLFDSAHIGQWLIYCRSKGMKLPCVLKVDTGMHRLGILPEQFDDLFSSPDVVQQLCPVMLMSHLACADQSSHALNEVQFKCFESTAQKVKAIYPNIDLSLSNSSGIFLGENFHFDVCRPGASLYGVNPTPHKANPMRSVVNLSLPVMQIRTIARGEAVGYGATFIAARDTRLATVFGGYADGLLRFMGGRGCGWCSGVKVPIVGRVSMDSIIFDVTDVVNAPDFIELLNGSQGVDDLASYAGTIGYEMLTGLGARYRREYIQYQADL
ncbi:MAG: alanine racemase [Cellvibrionaceae bacterium]|jgi:alanine racemase